MKPNTKAIAVALLALALPAIGCKVSETTTVTTSCGGGKSCTYGGTVSITVGNQSVGVAQADLSDALASGYSVVLHVPTDEFLYNSSSQPQATLTATTDQGYTSSIVVDLTLAGSAPSSLYSGYTAYTFSVQPSAQLTNWVNTVNSHMTSGATVATASTAIFAPQGDAGSYSIYAYINSTQTGTISNGSAIMRDPGSDPSCDPGTGSNKTTCGPSGTGI